MSEISTHTTVNGFEIEHPREQLEFEEYREMIAQYNLDGANPKERLDALKLQSKENVALFLTDLNRRVQGSDETLIDDETAAIAGGSAIAPEHRYDLFSNIMDKIAKSNPDTNPARVGDTLALATVLLHPFKDGNGRTARLVGLLYREDFDAPEAGSTFDFLAKSREAARASGDQNNPMGYMPQLGEGVDRSDPVQVEAYIDSLLQDATNDRLYTGPGGQSELIHPTPRVEQ